MQWYALTVGAAVALALIVAVVYLVARRSTWWRVDLIVQIRRDEGSTTERAAGDRAE